MSCCSLILHQAKEPAATLKSFEALFDGVQFRKGLEVAFATHHKGELVTKIDGKQVYRKRLCTWHCVEALQAAWGLGGQLAAGGLRQHGRVTAQWLAPMVGM